MHEKKTLIGYKQISQNLYDTERKNMKKEVDDREEAIECVIDSVLPMHKQTYECKNTNYI